MLRSQQAHQLRHEVEVVQGRKTVEESLPTLVEVTQVADGVAGAGRAGAVRIDRSVCLDMLFIVDV